MGLEERDHGRLAARLERTRLVPGLLVGWDIVPAESDWLILRTNLRYTPGASIRVTESSELPFDHLEFNFIQVIVYPGRLAATFAGEP